jgi:transposase
MPTMKAYSLDFCQKIFDTHLESGISQRQLAKKFCVSLSFVGKLLKQYRRNTKDISEKECRDVACNVSTRVLETAYLISGDV